MNNLKSLQKKYKKGLKIHDYEEFLDEFDKLCISGDLSYEMLIPYLNDNGEDYINEILINNATYLFMQPKGEELFLYIEKLIRNCPMQLETIFSIILNSEEGRTKFKFFMKDTDEDYLYRLFELIERESPHHLNLIHELKRELEN